MNRTLFAIWMVLMLFAPAAQAAGALAIDSNQGSRYGWWAGSTSKDHAAAQAVNSCGNGCSVVVQWETGCAAFAADQAINRGDVFSIGTGLNGTTAQSNAYRACTDRGGLNCQVRVWACDAPQAIEGGGSGTPDAPQPDPSPPVVTPPATTPPPPAVNPPRTYIAMFQQVSSGRYIDAYEVPDNDFQMATRLKQNDASQRWRITRVGRVGSGIVTIQQVSSERYVDAHEVENYAFRMVTRQGQDDATQQWRLTEVGRGLYTMQQVSSGRFADAYQDSRNNFMLVTRPEQNDATQQWRLLILE